LARRRCSSKSHRHNKAATPASIIARHKAPTAVAAPAKSQQSTAASMVAGLPTQEASCSLLTHGQAQDVAAAASASHEHVGILVSSATVPAHVEIQREVDATQAVYTEERRQLELQIRDLEGDVQRLWEEIATTQRIGFPCSDCGEVALLQRHVVWCLEGGGGSTGRGKGSIGVGGGTETPAVDGEVQNLDSRQAAHKCFQLAECPGVLFCLAFHQCCGITVAEGNSDLLEDHATSMRQLCRLTLEVSGIAAEGLHLGVSVAVKTDGQEASLINGERELIGAGEVRFEGTWPFMETVLDAAVTCQLTITVHRWEANIFKIQTDWPGAIQTRAADDAFGLDCDSDSVQSS